MQEKKAAQTFFSDLRQKAIETDPQYETYLSEEKRENIFKKMYDFFFSIKWNKIFRFWWCRKRLVQK